MTHLSSLRAIAAAGLLLLALSASAAVREGGPFAAFRFAEDDNSTRKVYIVELQKPAAAGVFARSAPKTAGKVSAPPRFDKNSAAVESYAAELGNEQLQVLAKAGRGTQQIYSYRYSFNGFAASMTAAQAARLENLPEVKRVWEDEIRPLATNTSADFLDLFNGGNGLRGAEGLDGDGTIIAVIDSGVALDHPSLQDRRAAPQPRLCESSWGQNSLLGKWLCRRFRRQPEVVLFDEPEDWNGVCEAGPEFPADSCNNKLIGARFYVEGAQNSGAIDNADVFSPLDVDGHGTHVATIAAGNRTEASIFGTFLGDIEGMAPRARIAVYKACWLRPGATRSTCNTSDLALAIDTAVADGVDIINYSVGSSMRDITAPDDVALMNATKAGVLAAVAGGNEGPNFATVGSPAGAPWVITAAASSRDGQHSLEAIEIESPASLAGRYASREASFTASLTDNGPIEADLVLVDDGDDTLSNGSPGTSFDACEPLVNDTEVADKIAFVQRGGCAFDIKIANAESAGAAAVMVFSIAGDPIVMNGDDPSSIPAVMIGQADGNRILDEINAGETVRAILDKGLFLTVEDTGNVMGAFSSRGPGPLADILKPDVTAPGINILAGFTPDSVNSVTGEEFGFLTGTSMSTPHVAGVAALLKQAHPDWSPAAIKSALMTTARQDVNLPEEAGAAIPFDFGSGHIVPNAANDPGLVFDANDSDYDAYACAIGSPGVDQARCDELRDAGASFDPSNLNQPSITIGRLASSQTVTRRVTNVADSASTYTASIVAPAGISTTVTPQTLTIPAGQTAEFDVTFAYESGDLNSWRFGSLSWSDGDGHTVRSVLATRPVELTAPAERSSAGASGSLTFPVQFGYDGPYTARVHGLQPAFVVADNFVGQDPDKTFAISDEGNGVTSHIFTVDPGEAYLRFALFDSLTDGNDDLDMYVFYCPDGVNCNRIGESGGETSREQFDVLLPGAGSYAVLVHGFETDDTVGGPGTNYDLVVWSFGLNDDPGNMTVTAPVAVSAGTTEDVTVNWTNLPTGTIYLGGISHNTPNGLVGITVIGVEN